VEKMIEEPITPFDLYNKYSFDFKLCIMSLDFKSKWRNYSECQADENFMSKVNNRQILDIEIVLDLEEPERFDIIIESLKKFNYRFKAYKTGSRGYHIHLIFPELRGLTKGEREKIKEHFIQIYDCDLMKKSDVCMIALECVPHWKTGKNKEIIIDTGLWDSNKIKDIIFDLESKNEKDKVLKQILRRRELQEGKIKFAFGSFTNFLEMGDKFLEIQPLYYDRNRIWYIWDFDNYKWVIIDETDILNSFDKSTDNPMITINSKTKNEIMEALRRRARLRQPKKPLKSWIQFKDKIVDVQTGEIKIASPEYLVMCPIPFEIGESEETPMLDKYFKDWVVKEGIQDESYIQTLYQTVAYSCLQDQFLQRLFALTGSGSNGKGCFIQLLSKFLGNENVTSSDMKVLTKNNFETSSFYQKQACFMGEVDSDDMANTTLLKKLTGEDLIRYEFKGKTAFSEKSGTTFFIATNSLPLSNDKSFGFYRRWLIIDFPNLFTTGFDVVGSVPEIEFNNLAKKIINITRKLYINKGFANEGSYQERLKRYEDRSNPMLSFIEKNCVESENDMVFSVFCKLFNEYCVQHRIRPMPNKSISKALREEGYIVKVKTTNSIEKTSSAFFIFNLNLKESIVSIENMQNQVQKLYMDTNSKLDTLDTFDTYLQKKPRFNQKELIHNPCCYPKGYDDICGKTPCNDLEGINYCQEHFEVIQEQNNLKTKEIDLRASNEV
jgi:P4 family phage/plasmid primase-like protien